MILGAELGETAGRRGPLRITQFDPHHSRHRRSMARNSMEYVRHPKFTEWGEGRVLSSHSDSTITVFFIHGGRRRIPAEQLEPTRVHDYHTRHIFDLATNVDWVTCGTVSMQLVEARVVTKRRFLDKNPRTSQASPASMWA